jgi:hypothetical protein
MKQMLTLEEWAAEKYRSHPPCLTTLQKYAKNRMFSPPAEKHGRRWRVREDAEIVGILSHPEIKKSDSPLLRRILSDGCETEKE